MGKYLFPVKFKDATCLHPSSRSILFHSFFLKYCEKFSALKSYTQVTSVKIVHFLHEIKIFPFIITEFCFKILSKSLCIYEKLTYWDYLAEIIEFFAKKRVTNN